MPKLTVLPHPDACPNGAELEAASGETVCCTLLGAGIEIG